MMRFWGAVALAAAMGAAGCGGRLVKQYEYEEEVRLNLAGSATVIVNASVPALVALRGLDLDPAPRARLDRARLREAFERPSVRVTRVSRPWRRHGRRFVQVRLQVEDVRRLAEAAPLAWSEYAFETGGDLFVFRQRVGEAAAGPVTAAGWTGAELVAFRLHVPSKIRYHTAGRDNLKRGNILVWEQTLAERLDGRPVEIEVRMERRSILYRTLWLFAFSFAAAVTVVGGLIWWAVRRG